MQVCGIKQNLKSHFMANTKINISLSQRYRQDPFSVHTGMAMIHFFRNVK
jgi:hypothetical protein